MNQQQIKYARQRIEQLYAEKRKEIQLKTRTDAVILTAAQKCEALRNGEFIVDKSALTANCYSWQYAIRFPAEQPAQIDHEEFKRLSAKLDALYTKTMDELMLGDNEEAAKLIKAFEEA